MNMKHDGNNREDVGREMPVTRRIVRDLQMQIESGRLSGGMKLPSIRELAEQYEISTAVTLAAYRELESRGFVERRAGSGTFVTGKGQNPRNSFFNWGNILPVLETERFLKEVMPGVAFSSFPLFLLIFPDAANHVYPNLSGSPTATYLGSRMKSTCSLIRPYFLLLIT